MGKVADFPPVWLALALVLVWGLDRLVPLALFGAVGAVLGKGLIGLGLALILGAAAQMVLARTTVIPRRNPRVLLTGGLFRLSRNPIYLGDALILTGTILWLDVPPGLVVLAGFVALIQTRFILDEEARLRAMFGTEFDRWARRTRRWFGWRGR